MFAIPSNPAYMRGHRHVTGTLVQPARRYPPPGLGGTRLPSPGKPAQSVEASLNDFRNTDLSRVSFSLTPGGPPLADSVVLAVQAAAENAKRVPKIVGSKSCTDTVLDVPTPKHLSQPDFVAGEPSQKNVRKLYLLPSPESGTVPSKSSPQLGSAKESMSQPKLPVQERWSNSSHQRLMQYRHVLMVEHERRFRKGMQYMIKHIMTFEKRNS